MSLTQFLVSYKGRIRRLHWWVASLSAGATSLITAVLEFPRGPRDMPVDPDTQHVEATGLLGLAVLAVGLANLWVSFALSVKRLHDLDRTGWWLLWQSLIGLLAGAGAVLACAGGWRERRRCRRQHLAIRGDWLPARKQGPNRFGRTHSTATKADA